MIKKTTVAIAISLVSAFMIVVILIFAGHFQSAYSEALPLVVNNIHHQQQQHRQVKVIEAAGHFANNQIENGSVTWIQGGLWHLEIFNSTTNINSANADKNSINAAKADFT
ncbi:MAG: hypothetical protein WBZ20_04540, partial [Nitrososphaeraceae archaeon]